MAKEHFRAEIEMNAFITRDPGFVRNTIADQLRYGTFLFSIISSAMVGTMNSRKARVIEGDIRHFASFDIFYQAAARSTLPREALDVLMGERYYHCDADDIQRKLKKVVAGSSASMYGDTSYLPVEPSVISVMPIESDVTDGVFNVSTGIKTNLLQRCDLPVRTSHSSLLRPLGVPRRKRA